MLISKIAKIVILELNMDHPVRYQNQLQLTCAKKTISMLFCQGVCCEHFFGVSSAQEGFKIKYVLSKGVWVANF